MPSRLLLDASLTPESRSLSFPVFCSMSEASWQEVLRQRLVERNSREAAYAPIIEQCAYHEVSGLFFLNAGLIYTTVPMLQIDGLRSRQSC